MIPRVVVDDRRAILKLDAVPKYGAAGVRRALNRTASRLRSRAIAGIRGRLNLKASYLREHINVFNASGTQTSARVVGRRRATRLDRFPNKQVYRENKSGRRIRGGVEVRVFKNKPGAMLYSGFYVPLRSGRKDSANGRGIAVRVSVLRKLGENLDSGSFGGEGDRRYEVLHGLSVASMFDRELQGPLTPETEAYLAAQVRAEFARAKARNRA